MSTPDFENRAERIDPVLQTAWEHLDTDIDVRIDAIAEELNIERDKVIALSVLFFSSQLQLRREDKMVIVCGRPAKAYPDPLAALFDQDDSGKYTAIYQQLVGTWEAS
ncbi:hypothetical protein ACH4VX_06975 [Streptomyces sp. NPDC020731]|uniref:hypothetical protein n=1 Tax=Streptomyces sp. NPDC020731 TaxID=3365085 RepID=UPI003788A8BD